MTTLNLKTPFSYTIDFVRTDTESLASHMFHCANSRGRFFALHSTLQSTHGLVCSHLVTVAALAAIGFGLMLLV